MNNQHLPEAARVHGRDTLRSLVCLSGALHVALFVCLLAFPAAQPTPNGTEPLFVDIITERGPDDAGAKLPTLPAAIAAPAAEIAPAETSPPTPPSAPDVPPFQPLEHAEIPPPIPAPAPEPPSPLARQLEASQAPPALSSDVPLAPPLQEADQPPSAPAAVPDVPPPKPARSAPPPIPSPLPRVGPVRPSAAQPQATPARPAALRQSAIRAPANPTGAAAPPVDGKNTATRATTSNNGVNNSAAWIGKLKQWWDQHSFYPKEASQTNDGGDVRVRIVIAADGQVSSIEVVQGSGSPVLDAAALAVFRNARLPPFPPGMIAQAAEVVVTLHYRPSDTGG